MSDTGIYALPAEHNLDRVQALLEFLQREYRHVGTIH